MSFQSVFAQVKTAEDSLFRLLDAQSAKQLVENGMEYRRVVGDARFLHNNTYFLCDSASWNLQTKSVEAFGNVKLIQDKTMLSSERMLYLIDKSTAYFSGGVVELTDKSHNMLRTSNLEYNTKDSTAYFKYGAAMKDKDGNVIESTQGSYHSTFNTFLFERDVEMYNDSTFIRTESLKYMSDFEKAWFGYNTYLWRGSGFMTANAGWYDLKNQVIDFTSDVYMNDDDYEAWADEVVYHKSRSEVEMYHNVQILDTVNHTYLLGQKAEYKQDSLKHNLALMTNNPSIVYYGRNENDEPDTLFMRADTLMSYALRMCDIPDEEITEAKKRKEDLLFDALEEFRLKQAEERKRQAEEKMKQAGRIPPLIPGKDSLSANNDSLAVMNDSLAVAVDSIPAGADSLSTDADSLLSVDAVTDDSLFVNTPFVTDSLASFADSLSAPLDSLSSSLDSVDVEVIDTTLVRHLVAYHNVRMYRADLQARCDSMAFMEIDSIMRMYGGPILWNEVKNQLTAETMQILMKESALYRGNMLSEAMITTREDSLHYNQIKSTEMVGFFKNNKLFRYDALGGVTAVFYMLEDNKITNVNIKESKSLTAVMKDGNPQKMLYLETVKSDAYPLKSIKLDKQRLKGFIWRGEERPKSRFEITDAKLKNTQRDKYISVQKPTYLLTDRYFDNYMKSVYADIELQRQKAREAQLESARQEAMAEFIAQQQDSIQKIESLQDSSTVATSSLDSTVTVISLEGAKTFSNEKKELIATSDSSLVAADRVATGSATDLDATADKPVVKKKLTCKEKCAIRRAERAKRRELRKLQRAQRKAQRSSQIPKAE